MRTFKLTVVALFVALAGAAYAAGGAQEAAHASHAAKAGCCKAHKQDAKQASHSCDMKDGECCRSGDSCRAAHKSEGAQAATATRTGAADAKAVCCDAECCKPHEGGAETQSAATKHGGEGHSCCASCGSCCQAQVARK